MVISRRRWLTRVYIHLPQSRPCRPCRVSGAVLRSSAKGGLPGRFHHPCLGMARAGPSRSIGPLPGGSKFFKVITGFKFLGTVHRQPSIQIRYRSNFAVPVSQMCSVMQLENRAGTTMTPALNQRPWSTSRRFTPIRRWAGGLIRMIPAFGVRWICRTGVPCRSAQGTVCRSRSGIPCRFRYWGTIPQPGWPQREAGTPVDPLPPDPAHPGFGLRA